MMPHNVEAKLKPNDYYIFLLSNYCLINELSLCLIVKLFKQIKEYFLPKQKLRNSFWNVIFLRFSQKHNILTNLNPIFLKPREKCKFKQLLMISRHSYIGISHQKTSIESVYTQENEEKPKNNVNDISCIVLISYFGKKIIIKSKEILINTQISVSYFSKRSIISDWIEKYVIGCDEKKSKGSSSVKFSKEYHIFSKNLRAQQFEHVVRRNLAQKFWLLMVKRKIQQTYEIKAFKIIYEEQDGNFLSLLQSFYYQYQQMKLSLVQIMNISNENAKNLIFTKKIIPKLLEMHYIYFFNKRSQLKQLLLSFFCIGPSQNMAQNIFQISMIFCAEQRFPQSLNIHFPLVND